MNCATGFKLQMPPEPAAGKQAQLIDGFRLEKQRVDGKIRVTALRPNQPTGVFVTIDSRLFESHGMTREVLGFPVEDLACPHCFQAALKSYFDDPDTCPSCGNRSLHRGVIWVSIV